MPFFHLIPQTIPVANQAVILYPASIQFPAVRIPADGAAGIPFAWLDFSFAHQDIPTPVSVVIDVCSVVSVLFMPISIHRKPSIQFLPSGLEEERFPLHEVRRTKDSIGGSVLQSCQPIDSFLGPQEMMVDDYRVHVAGQPHCVLPNLFSERLT